MDNKNSADRFVHWPHQYDAVAAAMGSLEGGHAKLSILLSMVPGSESMLVGLALAESLSAIQKDVMVVTPSAFEKNKAIHRFNPQDTSESDSSFHLVQRSNRGNIAFVESKYDFYEEVKAKNLNYDVVILLGVKLTEMQDLVSLPIWQNQADNFNSFSATTISVIEHTMTPHERDVFGRPVFTYTLEDAIREARLHPIDFITKTDISIEESLPTSLVAQFLGELLKQLDAKNAEKILIVCANAPTAKLIYKSINNASRFSPVLITKDSREIGLKMDGYCYSTRYDLAVCDRIYESFDSIEGLTDGIITYHVSDEDQLSTLYATVSREVNHKGKNRLWDFGGNRQWFKKEYGQLIDEGQDPVYQSLGFKSIPVKESKPGEVEDPESEAAPPIERKLAAAKRDKAATKDLLGRAGLVAILKGMIDKGSKHFIVALFGRWGTGKSSVIEFLMERYKENRRSKFIVFNAWQHGHSDNMTASIAQTIVDNLYNDQSELNKIILSLKGQYRCHQSVTYLYGLVIGLSILFIISYHLSPLLPGVGEDSTREKIMTTFVLTVLPIISIIIGAIFKSPYMEKLSEISKQPNFKSHIGLADDIKEQIKLLMEFYPSSLKPAFYKCTQRREWNNSVQSSMYKYILVVDDLDRCTDHQVLQTLEAVQLLMDIDNVVVILAIDDKALLRAVASKFNDKYTSTEECLGLAREYLGKILQITLTLDRPSISAREKFISEHLYADLSDAIGSCSSENQMTQNQKITQYDSNISSESSRLEYKGIFTDSSYFEDELVDYDESTDYLESDIAEYEFFKSCVSAFDIHNPRIMIRLHNMVTFVKGLYPDVSEKPIELKLYIYVIFWVEIYQSTSTDNRKIMTSLSKLPTAMNDRVAELAQGLVLDRTLNRAVVKAIHRVKNLSLPILDIADDLSGSGLE